MPITGGFGIQIDLTRGTSRQWVMGRDGIKRWADNGEPVPNLLPRQVTNEQLHVSKPSTAD